MIEAIAVDTSAAVDYLRPDRVQPEMIDRARRVFFPLPVVGELLAGALSSERVAENSARIDDLLGRWIVLEPTLETARKYAKLRAASPRVNPITPSKLNDFWIAALCVQHNLPLLTNDRGFDRIEGLTVIHW
jgi:predicted nucleic acid-binding protein